MSEINVQETREIELHTERCKAAGSSCNSKPYLEDIRRASDAKRQPLRRDIAAIDDQLTQRSMAALQSEQASIESALAAAAYENQIYRMAARFFGKRPEEVTVAEANFVGKVWFGSIGLIVAITGIVLAGAAVLVARPPQKAGALSRMMKRTLLAVRRRARVEVIRQIEVPGPERVVDRVVEKIVPQVRKIIVYLPRGYDLDEIDKADIEAEVEAQLSNGRFKFDHVGGHA